MRQIISGPVVEKAERLLLIAENRFHALTQTPAMKNRDFLKITLLSPAL
jgi:hypothetical protein